jgi:hypothetical protein
MVFDGSSPYTKTGVGAEYFNLSHNPIREFRVYTNQSRSTLPANQVIRMFWDESFQKRVTHIQQYLEYKRTYRTLIMRICVMTYIRFLASNEIYHTHIINSDSQLG